MPKSQWREKSRRKLNEILLNTPTRQEGESLESWGKRLKKAIEEGYPFAWRSGFAYKCWLSERHKLLAELGLSDPPKKPKSNSKRTKVQRASLEGQLTLFAEPAPTKRHKQVTQAKLLLSREVL